VQKLRRQRSLVGHYSYFGIPELDTKSTPCPELALPSDDYTSGSSVHDPFVVELFSHPSGNEGKMFVSKKAMGTNSNGTFSFIPS
jgi:hypothetical protein